MQNSLSCLVDNLTEINNKDKKISQETLIRKFPNTYQLCNKNLNKFTFFIKKSYLSL